MACDPNGSVQPGPTYLTSGLFLLTHRKRWDLLILKSSKCHKPLLGVEVRGVNNRLIYFPFVFKTPKKPLQVQAVPTIV